MKRYFLLFLFLFSLLKLPAQQFKTLPEYGTVDISELQLKECAFDKNAGAMVLFSEAESFFKIDLTAIMNPIFEQTEYHVRIKIFNKSGFDNASIKIKYPISSALVSIKHLSAQTYNLDPSGNIVVTKVDKSSVYDKKINKRFAEKIFAFPDVKEGSVIEFKYIMDGSSAKSWYFQRSIPVKFSRFIINFPEELVVSVVPNTNLPLQKGKDEKVSKNYSWYAMEDIPALPDEPYMSCREDYLQRLEVRLVALDFPGIPRRSLLRSWPGIIKELVEDDDFGKQLNKNIPRTSDLDAMLQPVNDPYQKMRIIHKYVRNNMQWNELDNIWALNGVKSAWKDKKGTSGEINLILINLLKDAGLTVHPILVSTSENGIINTGVPGFDQFNKVMAYVEIGDKHYVLDATEKNTPSHLIPVEVMASEGLLIGKLDSYEWGWKTLWDDTHKDEKLIQINAEIDEKGTMKGTGTLRSADYARLKLLPFVKQGNGKLKEKLLTQPDIAIDSFEVENADNDTLPLLQSFNFSTHTGSTNDYHYFSVNLFSGLDKNPFIADERLSDIYFGVNQYYNINSIVFLPDGYQMDDLPKNIKMITPDTSIIFLRHSNFADGLLSVTISVEFKRPFYVLNDYTVFKEYYKKMFDLLNDKYVYRKK